MYSVTKSFVGVSVLFAIDEGLLSLDDKFIKFFPEADNEFLNDVLKEATIEDMLTMESARQKGTGPWFAKKPENRVMVSMIKFAEDFMKEYEGIAIGKDESKWKIIKKL